jgi:hypothetical protein
MVPPIDERDVHRSMLEALCSVQPSEAASDDHDVWPMFHAF